MFDYIIVGAGSAGCVLANRLSENGSVRVLLVEAGPRPGRHGIWINMPAGVVKLIFPCPINWGFFTEPDPNLKDRKTYAPRGKTLGGSSAINGMVYVRGHAEDYESWRQLGNAGWSWQEVLPYFKKSEHREGGGDEFHGSGGELWVSDARVRHAITEDFVASAAALGVPRNQDYNGASQDGAAFLQFTIRKGVRNSCAAAFLAPAEKRPNLKIEVEALVRRILFEGRRAVGIEYFQGGEVRTARAEREVIVSAGTLVSPALLMRSGIGPAAELARHGIPVVRELPGVGENLQDHLNMHATYETTPDGSVNRNLEGIRSTLHGLWYLATHRGLMTIGASQAVAFVRVLPGAARPDVQISFRPMSWEFDPAGTYRIGQVPGITAIAAQLRPNSRGRITLRSAAAEDPPSIQPNYLADPTDQHVAIEGLKWMRRIFATEPIKAKIVAEQLPSAACQSDAELLDYIRGTSTSNHHWVGSCKMGPDPMAVVDERLRVHGVERLRVIDASIMPLITSGNTHAPSIMIGEKGADLIRRDA